MIFVLLVTFQLKHFIADYLLQNQYMLGKFKDRGWVLPLAAHTGVQALATFLIVLAFGKGLGMAVGLGLLDFTLHFIMDRIKASPKLLGRFKAITKKDYEDHVNVVSLFEKEIRRLSLTQQGLDEALNVADKLNEVKIEFHERMKSNVLFWHSVGLDQMVHHLTHYLIIYMMVTL